MANHSPTPPPEHYRFKKGQSGNPSGMAKHDNDIRKIKRLTNKELAEVANIVIKGDVDELRAIVANPKSTVLAVMMGAVAIKIIEKGDMHSLDILLNRLLGRVKENVKINGNLEINNAPQVVRLRLPDNGREVIEVQSTVVDQESPDEPDDPGA